MIDWREQPQRWRNFTCQEMQCRCGCGRADMDPDFMDWLQGLRDLHGRPITIASAYRCPDYNARVSKTGRDGPHATGKAVDIRCAGKAAHRILSLGAAKNAQGIGVDQKGAHGVRFHHFDILDGLLRPWVWSY